MTDPANWTLAEAVRAHWSARAATFDAEPGHRIDPGPAAAAWRRLLAAGLGRERPAGWTVLDLACGTGEISGVLLDLGASVTGADFAEPMLARAVAKHAGRDWRGALCDAQDLAPLPDAAFDAAVARHLVWTLTDPPAAFAAWARVLKPGGRLIVIDGDWAREGRAAAAMRALAGWLDGGRSTDPDRAREHREILARLPYGDGLRWERLRDDLAAAGFVAFRRLPLWRVYRLGLRRAPAADWLRLNAPSRFAIVARRRA